METTARSVNEIFPIHDLGHSDKTEIPPHLHSGNMVREGSTPRFFRPASSRSISWLRRVKDSYFMHNTSHKRLQQLLTAGGYK